MNTTKTGNKYPIGIPADVMRVNGDHVNDFPWESGQKSNLLFPSRVTPPPGKEGFISRSVLDRPFKEVLAAIHLPANVTPRAMRRTFQDLCREVGIPPLVQMAVCGHEPSGPDDVALSKMTKLYSTIRPDEMRVELSKLTALLLAQTALKKRKTA